MHPILTGVSGKVYYYGPSYSVTVELCRYIVVELRRKGKVMYYPGGGGSEGEGMQGEGMEGKERLCIILINASHKVLESLLVWEVNI